MKKRNALNYKVCFFCILLVLTANANAQQPAVTLSHSKMVDAEWLLQVKNTSLDSVFDEVGRIENVQIHYSTLPKLIVTATCVGSTLEAVLKCLMGDSVDMVFRYTSNDNLVNGLADVWILGSTLASLTVSDDRDCQPLSNTTKLVSKKNKIREINDDSQFIKLVTSFEQGSSKQRALALADLISNTGFKNIEIEPILHKAINDVAAIVRIQALFGYVHRYGGGNVRDELQQALQDSEAMVRMKAVELSEDSLLLEQASTDENEVVRWLALSKLDEQKNIID